MLLSFWVALIALLVLVGSSIFYEVGRRAGVQESSTLIDRTLVQRDTALNSCKSLQDARQEALAAEIATHKKLLQLRQAVSRSVVQLAEAAQIEVNTEPEKSSGEEAA